MLLLFIRVGYNFEHKKLLYFGLKISLKAIEHVPIQFVNPKNYAFRGHSITTWTRSGKFGPHSYAPI